MPRKGEKRHIMLKHQKEENRPKVPVLIFLLLEESDVRMTIYDSAGEFHDKLKREIGAISLMSYNLPLNGRGDQFSRTSHNSNYLVIHKTSKEKIDPEQIKELNYRLENIQRDNKKLKIFATPKVACFKLNATMTTINSVDEIIEVLTHKKH